MTKIAIATIKIAIEIPDGKDFGHVCKWLSETLRPLNGLVDWGYVRKPVEVEPFGNPWDILPMPDDYEEGDLMEM